MDENNGGKQNWSEIRVADGQAIGSDSVESDKI